MKTSIRLALATLLLASCATRSRETVFLESIPIDGESLSAQSAPTPDTAAPARADEPTSSDEELAKKAQNPIANLISLPFQNNTSFDIGPHDRTQNVLNIQPVIPFDLGDWNLITRTIAPVVYQPDVLSESGGTWGLGDINATLFMSPKSDSDFMWGAGPIFSFPTATDDVLGTGKWGIGPSGVVVYTPGDWVLGALVNNVWGAGGDSDRDNTNRGLFQYFVNYNLPDSWYLTSAPIITADWKEDQDDRFIVPFGGGIGKIFRIGRQPINTSVQAYYNVVRPDAGPRWSLRLQIQFLFPK